MLVSCITVTQAGRLPLLRLAVGDFARQTHPRRELIIVHDGDAACHAALLALRAEHPAQSIRVELVAGPNTLGALRNVGAAAARGECVCQWDDDDRYHPQRIALQVAELAAKDADFCFLSDQLHWFPARRELTWDDWDREPYPLNFVPGTLLGRRDALPRYPELARGEDSGACLAILEAGGRIARLRGAGWCYTYVYHGANVWSYAHHAAISRVKAIGAAYLLGREMLLRKRLAEYDPPLGALTMPYPGGQIAFS